MYRTKLVIIQTHPIQHFCPQFDSYANIPEIDLHVIFNNDKGLTPYFDKQFNKEIKWDEISLKNFNHTFLSDKKTVAGTLKIINPDIVMVYGYYQPCQKQAYKWAKINNKKILYVSDSTSHQKQAFWKMKLKKIRLKIYFSKIDFCLSVGDSNEELYRNYGINNSQLIRTSFPIDVNRLYNIYSNKSKLGQQIREQHKLQKETLVISTVGKIEGFKRHYDLVYLAKKLSDSKINYHIFIIGSGPEYDKLLELRNRYKVNVTLTGFLPPKEIMKYFCSTDIYLHPSSREAHSLSISEAIYLGCPVILSNRCGSYGPTDDVQPGKNGFVYQVGNITEIAKKVQYLYYNQDLLQQFSNASIEISRQNQRMAHGEALKAAINLIKAK